MKTRTTLSFANAACLARRLPLTLVALFVAAAAIVVWSPALRAQEPLEPPAKPDGESAAALFAGRCANCHGPTGLGDGEMAGNLPMPPRDFTSAEFRRQAVPSQMFQTITEGRLEQGMPPFGPTSSNPIDEARRWDLIATVFSLGLTPEEKAVGETIYQENCLACHGDVGQGDGPEAADLTAAPSDLSDLRYWSSRSNELVFTALQDETIEGHAYDLSEDDLWAVTDYVRTFSYVYYDPQAALEPIEQATIRGTVINESTGETVDSGTVTLRGYTMDLEEALTETAEIGNDGTYTVQLSDVAPDLVYMATVDYGGVNYNSVPDRLTREEARLEMPIAVFNTTTDPAAVNIEQIHMVLEFAEDQVLVNEIYVVSNEEAAVFVGETGNVEEGTFEFVLPAGAQNVNFQRSFGTGANFMAAPEVIETDRGWADTEPLRPGQGSVNLLVTYQMPFEDGVQIAHPVYYDTANATVIMPEVGVSLTGDGWSNQGSQQMGSVGTFVSYARPGLQAGEALSFELDGRIRIPQQPGAVASPIALDSTSGLIIGASVFLLVVVGAVFTVRSWRAPVPVHSDGQTEQLLQAVANLDNAFEAGSVAEAQYRSRREELLQELAQNWPQ